MIFVYQPYSYDLAFICSVTLYHFWKLKLPKTVVSFSFDYWPIRHIYIHNSICIPFISLLGWLFHGLISSTSLDCLPTPSPSLSASCHSQSHHSITSLVYLFLSLSLSKLCPLLYPSLFSTHAGTTKNIVSLTTLPSTLHPNLFKDQRKFGTKNYW